MDEGDLQQVIAGVYDAALSAERWQDALRRVTDLSGANWAAVGIYANRQPAHLVFHGVDPAVIATFERQYMSPQTNPAIPYLLTMTPGQILRREHVLSEHAWERSGLYNDVFRPSDTYDPAAFTLLRTDDVTVLMGLHRLRQLGRFQEHDIRTIRALIPHLQRAMQTFTRLRHAEVQRGAHEALWNRLSYGVILLDQQGRVLWANTKAERLLELADGLCLHKRLLAASLPAESSELRRLIADAANCANARGRGAGGEIFLTRASGRPLSVLVSPFRADERPISRAPSVVALVNDPDEAHPAAARFAQGYRLTRREAELIELLSQGCALHEAAERLQIGTVTARSHLRSAFAKTDTHRQSELVTLFLRSTPPWR
jgi:DNA-binding CsgD family transcriptional regulator/PAS domain-containing protein